jgi:uncharacterized membrane protein HdeD (DUF308 family)
MDMIFRSLGTVALMIGIFLAYQQMFDLATYVTSIGIFFAVSGLYHR